MLDSAVRMIDEEQQRNSMQRETKKQHVKEKEQDINDRFLRSQQQQQQEQHIETSDFEVVLVLLSSLPLCTQRSNVHVSENCIKYIKWHNEMRERTNERTAKKQQQQKQHQRSTPKTEKKKDVARAGALKKSEFVPCVMRADSVCVCVMHTHIDAIEKTKSTRRYEMF